MWSFTAVTDHLPFRRICGILTSVLLASRPRLPNCITATTTSASSTTVLSNDKAPPLLSRDEAAHLIDTCLLPKSNYGRRLNVGQEAQGLTTGNGDDDIVVMSNDPRLAFTYGEFPLSSLDQLLDCAEWHYHRLHHHLKEEEEEDEELQQKPQHHATSNTAPFFRVVDIGSGCGRLCLYMALTRRQYRLVTGIEIAHLLHQEAVQAIHRAEKAGWMHLLAPTLAMEEEEDCYIPTTMTMMKTCTTNTVSLLQGLAEDFSDTVLRRADLIFCYSTAWTTSGFSPLTKTLVLSHQWNQLLTSSCQRGCLVITTDRSLDTSDGSWLLLDQVEVGNPEVGGSIGYVHLRL